MGADASLDTIIKKFTVIYRSAKSFDLLMRDLYRADLVEHRLLWDRLFHGSRKGIRENVTVGHEDLKTDYISFLEDYRKAEDEGRINKCKTEKRSRQQWLLSPLIKLLNHPSS